ncbi:hypothetical protein [Mesorhizobium sp. M0025]|uniref:hypothetical protein n=1 Tax=Mesorhizobium sp. M0025 TaxID=2956846 RepID=UPI003335938B
MLADATSCCSDILESANCAIAKLMKRGGMYFPQFLVGMSATAIIVAIWTYIEAASIWTALGCAVLALIVLQVGYAGLVGCLIYWRSSEAADSTSRISVAAQENVDGI